MLIEDAHPYTVPVSASIRDVVANLTESGMLLALVVSPAGQLLGVVADGDVRRALLAGQTLEDSVETVMNVHFRSASTGSSNSKLAALCKSWGIQQIPIVDGASHLRGLFVANGESPPKSLVNTVFLLAGGKGVRLRPLTDETPKPMLRIGKKPILHHIIDSLKEDGFTNFNISVNYLAEKIIDYFGDGSDFGITVTYTRETEPLGTAGSLSLLAPIPKSPVVVMNGDVLLSADVTEMVKFHTESGADITAGVKLIDTEIPFGVFDLDGMNIKGLIEKPVRREAINAGIYVLQPTVVMSLEKNRKLDMTDLMLETIDSGKVVAFPIHEDWIDLGRQSDLHRAREALKDGKIP